MVRTLRRKRVSPWYNILSPSNSRVAILLRPSLTLCKIKHRYSGIFEEVIKSWSPGTSEGALDMSSVSDFYLQTTPPAKAILACLAILLDVRAILQIICRWPGDAHMIQSAKAIISNCDALVDLLESIEHVLNRLNIHTQIPPAPIMDEIVIKIPVELTSTLALVTKSLKQRGSSESALADVLICSPRSQICKDIFQGEGHRGSARQA